MTPRVPAVDPVKNVFKPSAASAPLVSPEKANSTSLDSLANCSRPVDVMLAVILLIGGVIGAQIGVGLATRLRAEQLRILLALLVVGVCLKLAADLVIRPAELYSLGPS